MRVCMIAAEYAPNIYGGLGRHVTDLAEALAALGTKVHVVTHRVADETPLFEQKGNLYVHRVQPPFAMDVLHWDCRTAINNCAYIGAALRVMREYRIDVLHAQEWSVCHALFVLRELLSVPVVCTVHLHVQDGGNPLFPYRDSQVRSFIESTDLLICCSRFMQEELMRQYEPIARVVVVPNGVFPARFPFIERLGDSIVFLGRLVPRKGVHDLIRAFHLVRGDIEGSLLILGSGSAPYEAQLRALASELGLAERIHFEGHVEHALLAGYLRQGRVLAVPSQDEPFGIVALEAMSSGLPVVAYEAGGLAEIIEDGVNGLTVRAGDVEGLADRLRYAYQHVDDLDAMRRNARRDVELHYTWERVAARTAELYAEVRPCCKDTRAS